MESNNEQENNLELMSFDLGEAGGGTQMIFAQKAINQNEHYVLTLGNGPKGTENQTKAQEPTKAANGAGKQLLGNFLSQFGRNKNANNQNAAAENDAKNLKLRCFKLSQTEGKKYKVEEYVTPQGVSDVARFFGAGQQPEQIM